MSGCKSCNGLVVSQSVSVRYTLFSLQLVDLCLLLCDHIILLLFVVSLCLVSCCCCHHSSTNDFVAL